LFPEFAGFPCQFRGARLFVDINYHYGASLTDRSRTGSPLFGENKAYFAKADFGGAKSGGSLDLRLKIGC
jgi:hypothetical protein